MKLISSFMLIFTTMVVILTSGKVTAQTPGPDEIYIEEANLSIKGDFARLYASADDPLVVFGLPISGEVADPVDGSLNQYFQKVRFTQKPEGVVLAPLGLFYLENGLPLVSMNRKSGGCQMFRETGIPVCHAFLDFYNKNNGALFFGPPVSDAVILDGRIVQFFRNTKLEWHPELPPFNRVTLGDLGRFDFDLRMGSTPAELAKTLSEGGIITPRVQAFVTSSLVSAGENQSLTVIVQDQFLQPIQNAQVQGIIFWPDGSMEPLFMPDTGENGISQASFQIKGLQAREIVRIQVKAFVLDRTTESSTWFRVWW